MEVSRRALMASAAVAATAGLVGCRGHATPNASASSSPGPVALAAESSDLIDLPGLLTAFNAAHPGTVVTARQGMPAGGYTLLPANPSLDGTKGLIPLDTALRTLNFDPKSLLTGTLGGYTVGGATWALPSYCLPWGVVWRTDAFAAAGLPPPAPDWTLADFQETCTVLQSLAASGKVDGLKSALGPIVSSPPPRLPPHPGGNGWDALSGPGLWQAFVWGFGGTVATPDGFRLADDATVSGIEALVELITAFAPVAPGPTGTTTTFSPVAPAHAMALATYGEIAPSVSRSGVALEPPFAWARLPRFPVSPVIPVVPFGECLHYAGRAQTANPGAPQVRAAATFLLWATSSQSATTLMAATKFLAPVTADATAQATFWSARGMNTHGLADVGDWQHFRGCYDTFPTVPSDAIMYGAIADVATGRATLHDALGAAEQQMNAALAAAGSGAGA